MDLQEEDDFVNSKIVLKFAARLNIKVLLRGLQAPQLLYMNVEKELNEIVSKVLEQHPGIFLVETNHLGPNYEIVIDGDKPLGIYDISAVSREINHIADEKMPEEKYSLDVASPGADSDLKLLRQFPKHTGREFQVSLTDSTSFNGKLLNVEGETLQFETFRQEKPKKKDLPEILDIQYSNIKKANIILSFK